MKHARVVVVLVSIALLAGCATAPQAQPAPSATATATMPSPTPTPTPEPEATTIVVGGRSAIITDQHGAVMFEVVYSAPDPATIETITALLGVDPTYEELRRGAATDAFAGTVYTWDGFSIAWSGRWEDEPGSGRPRLFVSANTASASGVAVQTPDGLAVGQEGDLLARFPDSSRADQFSDGTMFAQAWLNCIPIPSDFPDAADCAGIATNPADGPITSIFAPYELNHGL